MKRISVTLATLLLVAGLAFAQNQPPVAARSYDGGFYFSQGYNYGINPFQNGLYIDNAPTATGAGTITLRFGYVILPDGRRINPFTASTLPAITINDANPETVTPSAASCTTPDIVDTCTITATFANLHGRGSLVISGDQGIQEAINDAALNGGGLLYWTADTGIVTLATGGLTTTTTTLVPSNFISVGASGRVTTTIATTASWAVGISGATTAFCNTNATRTAGTTCLASMNNPTSVGTTQALTAILITGATSNPTAGAVKIRAWGLSAIQAAN